MKKKRMIMKILKRNDLYENFEKRGEEETKSMPHAPVGIIPLTFSDKFYTLVCYLHVHNM